MTKFFAMKDLAEDIKNQPELLNELLASEAEFQRTRAAIAAEIAGNNHRRLGFRKFRPTILAIKMVRKPHGSRTITQKRAVR